MNSQSRAGAWTAMIVGFPLVLLMIALPFPVAWVPLALFVGLTGPPRPAWIMTAGNVQSLSRQDASTAAHFFNTPAAYGAGASLVKTPVQARYDTTPLLAYTSYARFSSDIRSDAIRYPYQWVMYDPENWSATPAGERIT